MASLSVSFETSGTGGPGQDLASVSVDGPSSKNATIAPGGAHEFDVEPGTYRIRASVATQAGVDWTVTVSPEGGSDQSKSGTGPGAARFPSVRVKGAAQALRALSPVRSFAQFSSDIQSAEPLMTNIHLKLTVQTGTKWSATLSCDGETIITDTSEIEELDFEDDEPTA